MNELFAYLDENIVAERRIVVAPDGQTFTVDPNGTPAMIVGVDDGGGL